MYYNIRLMMVQGGWAAVVEREHDDIGTAEDESIGDCMDEATSLILADVFERNRVA